jgi:hypothetical protein
VAIDRKSYAGDESNMFCVRGRRLPQALQEICDLRQSLALGLEVYFRVCITGGGINIRPQKMGELLCGQPQLFHQIRADHLLKNFILGLRA